MAFNVKVTIQETLVELCRGISTGANRIVARWEPARKQRERKRLAEQLKGQSRIHVGCGEIFVPGWLNIGLLPSDRFPYAEMVRAQNGALALSFDVSDLLPIENDSLHYIYASHFIEHLKLETGITFLKRCYKMLNADGVLRLTFPDMELWVNKYYENDAAFFEGYKSIYLTPKRARHAQTKGQIFMSQVHGFGHRWNYDFDSMRNILEKIGFSHITRKGVWESELPDIDRLEPKEAGRIMETAYVEAHKV
ncbi:MAG: hypothetical protein Q8R76_08315 [Candidatus Omnitrophota bacterium]|nr:hypothetical protein [Candidatus Omnitrophota bacterium]